MRSYEAAEGDNELHIALSLGNLGAALLGQRKYEEAEHQLQRAVRSLAAAQMSDHPEAGRIALLRAKVALGQEDFARCRTHAERAISVLTGANGPLSERADAKFMLARALWADPAEHSRAHGLANEAHEVFEQQPAPNPLEDVSAQWLQSHPSP